MPHETFWKLSLLHGAPVPLMDTDLIWQHVAVPVIGADALGEWIAIKDIQRISFATEGSGNDRKLYYRLADGRTLGFTDEMKHWYPKGGGECDSILTSTVMRFARLYVKGDCMLEIVAPNKADKNGIAPDPGFGDGFSYLRSIPFTGDASDCLIANAEIRIVNQRHPLVELVQAVNEVPFDELKDIERFCAVLVWNLTNKDEVNAVLGREVKGLRSFRRMGQMYCDLNWEKYSEALKPPYKVWSKGLPIREITHEELESWSRLTAV
jgi:hypothetical protein